MMSRGATAADTGDPLPLVRRSVNAAPPAGRITRTYAPDPDQRLPLTLTALAGETVGTNGNASGKSAASWACSPAKVRRKFHDVYCSSGGVAKPGRLSTQFAKAQRLTTTSNGCPVCCATLAAPVVVLRTRRPGSESPN